MMMSKQLNKTEQVEKVEQPRTAAFDASERTRTKRLFTPRTDTYESDDHIVLLAEMPGVAPDAVDITLEKRALTIRGETSELGHRGYRQVYAEYADGDYERVFTLSEDIDRDRIEASHNNGILRLTLPKAPPAKTQKIKVKSA
jgi:HSP20 family molecular chaperone IbpA